MAHPLYGQAPGIPASPAFGCPDRDMGGFQGLVHDSGQILAHRIQIHGAFQPAASVEAATATVLWKDSTFVASSTSPAYRPTSRPVTIA